MLKTYLLHPELGPAPDLIPFCKVLFTGQLVACNTDVFVAPRVQQTGSWQSLGNSLPLLHQLAVLGTQAAAEPGRGPWCMQAADLWERRGEHPGARQAEDGARSPGDPAHGHLGSHCAGCWRRPSHCQGHVWQGGATANVKFSCQQMPAAMEAHMLQQAAEMLAVRHTSADCL